MKLFFSALILILMSHSVNAQIKGTVKDKSTGTPVQNAEIYVKDLSFGTTTDKTGSFTLQGMAAGRHTIIISCLGYVSITRDLTVTDLPLTLEIEIVPASVNLGEVLVTSPKYTAAVKDVAIPLEVLNHNNFDTKVYNTAPDALNYLPGVSLTRDGAWATDLSIRGFSGADIVLLVDGNRVETATEISARMALIDFNDIERVEIIKGSSSSLYGSGALGGIVNFITKAGSYSSKFYLNGSVSSSYNSVNKSGNGFITLSTGMSSWYLKLAGTLRGASDTETPEGPLNNSRFHDNNMNITAGLLLNDHHEFKLNYGRYSASDAGIPGASAFPSSALARYTETYRAIASVEYTFKGISSTLTNLKLKYFNQFIKRDVEVNVSPAVRLLPAANHITNGVQLLTNWLLSENDRLTAGVDLWQRNLESNRERYVSQGGNLTIIREKPLPAASYRSAGLFFQNDYELLNGNLILQAGARADQIFVTNEETFQPEYTIVNGNRNDNPPGKFRLWAPKEEENYSWSFNLGALWKISKKTDLTLNVARSFRSPSIEERYQYIDLGSAVRLGDPALNPEYGWFFDFGARYWADNLSVRANAFIYLMNDLVAEISGTFNNKPAFIYSNIGKARIFGFDLSAEYNLIRNLNFYGNLSSVTGEDTENNTNLPQIPPFKSVVGIRYIFSGLFTADFNGIIYADQRKPARGEIETGGAGLMNLYISSFPVDLGYISVTLSGGIENITDRLYRNHLATNRGLIKSEPGRNFFAKVTLSW